MTESNKKGLITPEEAIILLKDGVSPGGSVSARLEMIRRLLDPSYGDDDQCPECGRSYEDDKCI